MCVNTRVEWFSKLDTCQKVKAKMRNAEQNGIWNKCINIIFVISLIF